MHDRGAMRPFIRGNWSGQEDIGTIAFTCGYCGRLCAASQGYVARSGGPRGVEPYHAFIVTCAGCNAPTLIDVEGKHFPPRPAGRAITGLPEAIGNLYDEARACITANAHTGCTMICRVILMHVAADQTGTKPQSYQKAVTALHDNGVIASKMVDWVSHVKDVGNDANHDLDPVSEEEAMRVLLLVETLLSVVYEAPKRIADAKA